MSPSDALGPSSHVIWSARRPSTACQYVSAMTATPLTLPTPQAPVPSHGVLSSCTTCRTPGIPLVRVASKLRTLPPNTGERSTLAMSMPGMRTSMPNCAVPFTLDGVSRRCVRWPSRRKSFGSLSGGFAGTGSAAAFWASSPYVSRWLVPVCATTPFSVLQAAGSAPQVCAAAATSIARAVAPALRRMSHDVRTLVLPPVDIRRDQPAGFSGTGPIFTFDQSASSSSATIIASAV